MEDYQTFDFIILENRLFVYGTGITLEVLIIAFNYCY